MRVALALVALVAASQAIDFFDLSATDIEGNTQEFSAYRGKVVLVVNVATE